jgi:YHS domain-containing protein
MAHRVNVVPVGRDFFTDTTPERIEDPQCGKKINRKDSRHMLFRGSSTLYFCSKSCLDLFMGRKPKAA